MIVDCYIYGQRVAFSPTRFLKAINQNAGQSIQRADCDPANPVCRDPLNSPTAFLTQFGRGKPVSGSGAIPSPASGSLAFFNDNHDGGDSCA